MMAKVLILSFLLVLFVLQVSLAAGTKVTINSSPQTLNEDGETIDSIEVDIESAAEDEIIITDSFEITGYSIPEYVVTANLKTRLWCYVD
jgi:hypothetical protein